MVANKHRYKSGHTLRSLQRRAAVWQVGPAASSHADEHASIPSFVNAARLFGQDDCGGVRARVGVASVDGVGLLRVERVLAFRLTSKSHARFVR